MDTTLVSYMYRIKNIYVLLKGNETTDVTQVPLFFLRVMGYVAVNMINAIQTKCIKGAVLVILEPVAFATSKAHAIGTIFTGAEHSPNPPPIYLKKLKQPEKYVYRYSSNK